MTPGRSLLAAALLAAVGSAPCLGDMLQLKDGRFVEGIPMKVDGSFIVLAYKNGEVRVPLAEVEDYLIEGSPPPEPDTEAGKEQRAKGLVIWKGKWIKPEQRDKLYKKEIEDRKAELAEAKAHCEWRNRYQFQSKYFKFESTMPPALNEHYSQLMDAYFEAFKKDWGITVPKGWGKLKVCFYPDLESFQKTAGVSGGVLAYYMFLPNPERELNFFNERREPRMTETVMFHECNHYLVDLFGEGLRYPHWVGEAMAEYYGASTYDPRSKTVKVGQIQEGRLVECRDDIAEGKRYQLSDMILKNSRSSYEDYYWGWSFVHFMMETPAYQKKFKQFFVDLARGSDVDRKGMPGYERFKFSTIANDEVMRVFKKRLGVDDLDVLQKEWYAYVDKLEAPGLRGIEKAGKSAFWNGQRKFRAPRLLKQAIDQGSRDASCYILYSRCLRMKSDGLEQALATMTKACELDPLDGDVWAERAFVVRLMGNKDESKKLLALANELNPGENYLDIQSILMEAGAEGEK